MESLVKAQLLAGSRHVLKPIVRLLIKTGMNWREFADIAKRAFVEVVAEEYGKKGRAANVSRIAILTGLSRQEARRLRAELSDGEPASTLFLSRGSRILSGWHQDPDFLNTDGAPRELSLAEGERTFADLSRRYGGDVPVVAMLKELKAADAVVETADGRIRAVKRAYIPQSFSEENLKLWASILHDMGATLEHNITRQPGAATRFERRATSLRVDRTAVPAFRQFLESEGQALLERADHWLTAHEVDARDADPRHYVRLGVGIYQIEQHAARRKAAAS